MLSYIEYLNLPTKITIALVGLFLLLQIVGEVLELKGKVVPEFVKVRKYFKRKKEEKNETAKALKEVKSLLEERKESSQALKEVKQLLSDVNQHYSEDNIKKRDSWMQWVNDRAEVYDSSIVEILKKIDDVVKTLQCNTRMTEEMFVQNSRDRIIDFATKVGNENSVVSREEFNRIFKVHEKYESFLEEHKLTNGEIDIAMHIIRESYENHIKKHNFIEDVRGYGN